MLKLLMCTKLVRICLLIGFSNLRPIIIPDGVGRPQCCSLREKPCLLHAQLAVILSATLNIIMIRSRYTVGVNTAVVVKDPCSTKNTDASTCFPVPLDGPNKALAAE